MNISKVVGICWDQCISPSNISKVNVWMSFEVRAIIVGPVGVRRATLSQNVLHQQPVRQWKESMKRSPGPLLKVDPALIVHKRLPWQARPPRQPHLMLIHWEFNLCDSQYSHVTVWRVHMVRSNVLCIEMVILRSNGWINLENGNLACIRLWRSMMFYNADRFQAWHLSFTLLSLLFLDYIMISCEVVFFSNPRVPCSINSIRTWTGSFRLGYFPKGKCWNKRSRGCRWFQNDSMRMIPLWNSPT